MSVQPADFGKDHWSVLAYVESCCVDAKDDVGRLDRLHMRCSVKRHPLLANRHDGARYPTRLAGGREITNHDDWDCLEDLEAAGYVEVVSLVNGYVRMTKKGSKVAGRLRAHKARGGAFAEFSL